MKKCDWDYPKSTDAIKIKNLKNKRVLIIHINFVTLKNQKICLISYLILGNYYKKSIRKLLWLIITQLTVI